jgi:hypothetical protein
MNLRLMTLPPVLVAFAVLSGCTSFPLTHTKGTYDRPTTILINLPFDPRNWREDWRSAFESHGYRVVFQDEAVPSASVPNESQGAQYNPETPFEFHLTYHGIWDIVWYVSSVDLTVRDLRTGQVVANYSDKNMWAHPSVKTVVQEIERELLSSLWTQK